MNRLSIVRRLYRGELMVAHAELRAVLIKADGSQIDYGVVCRKKVTRAFAQKIVQNMSGDATNIANYRYHDTGSGSTAEANTDTGLVTPVGPTTRATGTRVAGGSGASYTYTSVATVGPYPSDVTVNEHIVADSANRATSEILDRSIVSPAISPKAGDSITFTYTLTVTAET